MSANFPQFDAHILEQLACPVCFGVLRLDAASGVQCTGCGRVYPLMDGIPVLIPNRAVLGR
ncbi:Trm112 family protein [Acidicapsa ligni]|uniref:Trm112 family protein n=1 Tax=Acidicapsa ligni TaxID=542300 RepID=UPI0021E09DAA|nr:Trm112 family protein [Acidicapsa ligni]